MFHSRSRLLECKPAFLSKVKYQFYSFVFSSSRDKRDIDIVRENHKFLWDEDKEPTTWEQRLAKKYHDKLFKEYCICDLSRFKENKVNKAGQSAHQFRAGPPKTCQRVLPKWSHKNSFESNLSIYIKRSKYNLG